MRIYDTSTNTAIENEDTSSFPETISEYKIGHTTYIVQTQFNMDCDDTLENVLKRLIIRDICAAETAA